MWGIYVEYIKGGYIWVTCRVGSESVGGYPLVRRLDGEPAQLNHSHSTIFAPNLSLAQIPFQDPLPFLVETIIL